MNSPKSANLFSSAEWSHILLEGFGARSARIEFDTDDYAVLNIFRGGPFSVGYINFPIGGTDKNRCLSQEQADHIAIEATQRKIDQLRLRISMECAPISLPGQVHFSPQTVIPNLRNWKISTLSSPVQRALRKAQREGLYTRRNSELITSDLLWSLYRSLTVRHGAAAKYTHNYFRALKGVSRKSSGLNTFAAQSDNRVDAVVVVASAGETAVYLHGLVSDHGRLNRAGDLAIAEAIHWCRQQGFARFDFLASPSHQSGLVRYKEKWGGKTEPEQTIFVPIHSLRARLLELSLHIRGLFRPSTLSAWKQSRRP